MYTMVLMMAAGSAGESPDFFKKGAGCTGTVAAAPAGCTGFAPVIAAPVVAAPVGCTGTVVAAPAGCTGAPKAGFLGIRARLFGGGASCTGSAPVIAAPVSAGCTSTVIAAPACGGCSAPAVSAPVFSGCAAPVAVGCSAPVAPACGGCGTTVGTVMAGPVGCEPSIGGVIGTPITNPPVTMPVVDPKKDPMDPKKDPMEPKKEPKKEGTEQ